MKANERISGCIWALLGVLTCIGAFGLKIGNLHKPGPGFMPLLAGALLIICGLVLSISSIISGTPKQEVSTSKADEKKPKWKMFIICLVALFGYALLLEPLGFYSASALFLFTLFKLAEPKKWFLPVVVTAGTITLSYLIFSLWFKISFPGGVTGF